jgi:hypothetical protein
VDGTGSGSYRMVGFLISGVEPSGSASNVRVAIHVTKFRKACVWEGKPERVWRIRPEGLARNRTSDKSAVA